jgi:hypothetical protein
MSDKYISALKDHMLTLNEEISYRENILKHKKSLEATLWGLEEQIRFPENQSNLDQEEINVEINNCQLKILNCNKLLDKHLKKLIDLTENFNILK